MATGHRVIIKHLTGTKASKVEEFRVPGNQVLVFGRDPSCDVRFDKDQEDLVSRHHVKLLLMDPDQSDFALIDLSSLNGTFVNSEKVTGLVKLRRGDVIQLGRGGPEFAFNFEPSSIENKPVAETTGEDAEAQVPAAAPTPATAPLPAAKAPLSPSGSPTASPTPRGRFPKARSSLITLVLILLAVAAVFLTGSHRAIQRVIEKSVNTAELRLVANGVTGLVTSLKFWVMGSSEIVRENLRTMVRVESSWRLIDKATGRQIRHVYIPNKRSDSPSALVPNAGKDLPVFVLLEKNRLQPLLTIVADSHLRPIGGKRRDAGFVVRSNGLILTSRGATEPWLEPFQWPPEDTAGVVVVLDDQFKLSRTAVISRRQFPQWLPIHSEFIVSDSFKLEATQPRNRRGEVDAKLDDITAIFEGHAQRVPASAVSKSDHADLATIRVSPPFPLEQVRLREGSEWKTGDSVVLVGFQDVNQSMKTVVWSGKVALKREFTPSSLLGTPDGDRYRLTSGAPVTEILGGPIFDNQGRVAGVQSEPDPEQPSSALAVPIRYGFELIAASER